MYTITGGISSKVITCQNCQNNEEQLFEITPLDGCFLNKDQQKPKDRPISVRHHYESLRKARPPLYARTENMSAEFIKVA